MSNDGATVVQTEDRTGECMGRWKHRPMWHGEAHTKCSTCGQINDVKFERGLSSSAAETRPSDRDIVKGLAKQFGCPEAVAAVWLNQMFIDQTREMLKSEIARHRPAINGWFLTALRSPT